MTDAPLLDEDLKPDPRRLDQLPHRVTESEQASVIRKMTEVQGKEWAFWEGVAGAIEELNAAARRAVAQK
jgi:hypothetical protein